MALFLPITKVDEEKRLVFGVASAEELDNAGEIFDYATSKPYIEAWSQSFVEKTNGLSYGNLRAMHRPISAGKLVQIDFDDDNKKVDVCAKVVDDQEWDKVLEGVYTGFSFSGKALKKWQDATLPAKRYTLKPTELSLADKPCVPSAVFFEIVKIDGSVEKRPFKGGKNVPDDISKNMYDVSSLANLLQTLNNIRQSAVWEAEAEGDNSPVPDKLKEAINGMAAILVEMTQEEAAELTAKLDESGTVQKAGARNSKEDLEKLQTMHDHCVSLGACCNKEEVNKVAQTDMNKVDLETEIQKVLTPVTESMQKLSGVIEQQTSTITELQKRLEKLEAQPEPAKAVVKTVGKGEDNSIAKTETSGADDALNEIKKAHNSPTWAY